MTAIILIICGLLFGTLLSYETTYQWKLARFREDLHVGLKLIKDSEVMEIISIPTTYSVKLRDERGVKHEFSYTQLYHQGWRPVQS